MGSTPGQGGQGGRRVATGMGASRCLYSLPQESVVCGYRYPPFLVQLLAGCTQSSASVALTLQPNGCQLSVFLACDSECGLVVDGYSSIVPSGSIKTKGITGLLWKQGQTLGHSPILLLSEYRIMQWQFG